MKTGFMHFNDQSKQREIWL